MKVIRIAEVETVPIATATPIPGWTGGDVKRTRQPILPEGASKHFNSSIVNFERGATTGWHVHKSDQILVVTAGVGMVADESHGAHWTVGVAEAGRGLCRASCGESTGRCLKAWTNESSVRLLVH